MKKFAKSRYRFIFPFLILVVLGGSEFFHHHESPEAENQCQACVLSNTLSSSDVDSEPAIHSFYSFEYITYSLEQQEPESNYHSSISSRAPPFSS